MDECVYEAGALWEKKISDCILSEALGWLLSAWTLLLAMESFISVKNRNCYWYWDRPLIFILISLQGRGKGKSIGLTKGCLGGYNVNVTSRSHL